MLDSRPYYELLEIAKEIECRGQLDNAVYVYLEEGLLQSYVNYLPYLSAHRTELTSEFWRGFVHDQVMRPGRRNGFRVSGHFLYGREGERLETISQAALNRDPTLIDPLLQPLAMDIGQGLEPASGFYAIRLLNLFNRLEPQLQDAKSKNYTIYVSSEEWQRFRAAFLTDPTGQRVSGKETWAEERGATSTGELEDADNAVRERDESSQIPSMAALKPIPGSLEDDQLREIVNYGERRHMRITREVFGSALKQAFAALGVAISNKQVERLWKNSVLDPVRQDGNPGKAHALNLAGIISDLAEFIKGQLGAIDMSGPGQAESK